MIIFYNKLYWYLLLFDVATIIIDTYGILKLFVPKKIIARQAAFLEIRISSLKKD
jgi:hypothetical protein